MSLKLVLVSSGKVWILSGGLRWELVVCSFTQYLKHLCPWQFHCLCGKLCVLFSRIQLFVWAHGRLRLGEAGVQAHILALLWLCVFSACLHISGAHVHTDTAQRGSAALFSKSQQCAWIQWWHDYTLFLHKQNCTEKSREDGRWELQLTRCGGLQGLLLSHFYSLTFHMVLSQKKPM